MRTKAVSGLLLFGALTGCAGDTAPVVDGSYLTYAIGGTQVQVTFEAAGGGNFTTQARVTNGDGSVEEAQGMPGHGETVGRDLRVATGAPLEVASFGPIWAPPGELTDGGRVYGSPVSEVRSEQGRDVAVVAASFGIGAAISGEWMYDVATGFSVGGTLRTAPSGADGGQTFRLVATNVPGLVVP